MTRALLYQPGPRWRIGVALGAAALIHFAAIGLANIHREEHDGGSLPPWEGTTTSLDFEPESPSDSSTPPPDAVDLPAPNPTDESIVPEERSTPPPVHRQSSRPATPIAKNNGTANGPAGLSSAKVSALSAPRPEYPYEARRQKITGSGIVVLAVDRASGSVTSVAMEASTGSPLLDNAAVAGFRRCRFKPGTVSRVRSPITYTLAGAAY